MLSCTKDVQLSLLNHKILQSFPSGSAIEYYNSNIYLLGDDAKYLLILDTSYNFIDSIHYFHDTAIRISKEKKPDLESATLLTYGESVYLYTFGSLSTTNRKGFYSFPLKPPGQYISGEYSLPPIDKVNEWNIEGAAVINDLLVFVNRANQSSKKNYIIITNSYQTNKNSEKDNDGSFTVFEIILPGGQLIKGISGLYYYEKADILFFTASEENSYDAISDGSIGDSYIGWFKNFSRKLKRSKIKPDHLISLKQVDPILIHKKIESICIQDKENPQQLIIHLVADNDNGETELFKIALTL